MTSGQDFIAGRTHSNSQHVLAVVMSSSTFRGSSLAAELSPIRMAFGRTSELPCAFWYSPGDHVLLGANYPHCIQESSEFAVLCGGMPYGFRSAFAHGIGREDLDDDSSSAVSLAHCILQCAESTFASTSALLDSENASAALCGQTDDTKLSIDARLQAVQKALGSCLKQVSGHFTTYLCHKSTETLLAYNDPFGFMPLFYTTTDLCVGLSSYWDCLPQAPGFGNLSLDLHIVAEYLTLGSTLGGRDGCRTFCQGVRNASPGLCLCITDSLPFATGTASQGRRFSPAIKESRYTRCFGGCELASKEAHDDALEVEAQKETLSNPWFESDFPIPACFGLLTQCRLCCSRGGQYTSAGEGHVIAGVKVEKLENQQKRLAKFKSQQQQPLRPVGPEVSSDNDEGDHELVLCAAFLAVRRSVSRALRDVFITEAALTGGCDTRLALSCLTANHARKIVFQTHAKQQTDWRIARWIAGRLGLRHKKIKPGPSDPEGMMSMLHDQVPLRKQQRRCGKRYKEEVATHAMHGRFGTEFFGFLCFDKTSIAVRCAEDVQKLESPTTWLFHAMFINAEGKGIISRGNETIKDDMTVCNPIRTLLVTMQRLAKERDELHAIMHDNYKGSQAAAVVDSNAAAKKLSLEFDTAYALQLQLFTRAFLCDIYGGLRGGSWFAMPYAYFTRNAFSPFLDSQLLRLLLCRVPVRDKVAPFEWYARVYRCCVPQLLLQVPSNNKLLCMHAGMPRAMKEPEKSRPPFHPDLFIPRAVSNRCFSNARKAENVETARQSAIAQLRCIFTPVFWDGAVAITATSAIKMNTEDLAADTRPEVQALVNAVGPHNAGVLSARLASFLLWYERRFLPAARR